MSYECFSPAKVNLFLRIEGQREDGYHNLTSLVAPLAWGDVLGGEVAGEGRDSLEVDGLPLEVTPDNLILRATAAFRDSVPELPPVCWKLTKRIPWGAGLGGGSSNAAAALRLCNQMMGEPLDLPALIALGGALGADVPLFLRGGVGWMSGIGHDWCEANETEMAELRKWNVAVFHPGFPISTPWAYRTLASRFRHIYGGGKEVDRKEVDWKKQPDLPNLLFNTLEEVAFSKWLAIPVLLSEIRQAGFPALMSGSGSACFALLRPEQDPAPLAELVQEAWGIQPILTHFHLPESNRS